MKKLLFVIFVSLAGLISAQSNYQLIISGSADEPVLNPIFSPDGKNIAFTKTGYQGIWIYNLQTQSSFQLTDEAAAGFGFKWSGDSKSILTRVAKYENNRRYNAVKIFNIETKNSKQLSDYRTMMPYLPSWANGDSEVFLPVKGKDEVYSTGKEKNSSNNSNVIMFEKNNQLIIRNLDNNSEQSFEPIKDAQYINLSISPDRTKMVFEVVGGNFFAVNMDGTNLTDIGKGNRPRWSSDSKKIIYTITEDDGQNFTASDIFVVNSDGTQKSNLTYTTDLIEMNPCFATDGKSIVFDVVNNGSIFLMNIE